MNNFQDCYTLNNGMKLPCMGFGTYNAKGGDNLLMIETAIKAGYRYFDTASLYETERALGQAVKKSGIARDEFVIASKAWIDEMGYEQTKKAFERSLNRLGTDYLDLYLIHWPRSKEGDTDWKERDLETWRAMEELLKEGKVKGIGVCNFLPHHLNNLLNNSKTKPVVDQLELHPGYSQEATVTFCLEHDIRPQAWSPLARGADAFFNSPVIQTMSDKYGKSAAQIGLHFLVQKGIIPLPKASSMDRMKENQDIFSFELTEEEMWILSCMPQNLWQGEHPDFAIPKKESNINQ